MMRQTGVPRVLPLAFVAGVAVTALLFLTAMAAYGMSHGNWGMGSWGMGSDHMQQMMGGGVNSSNAPLSTGSKAQTIDMRNFAFAPGNVQVPVGAAVTWTNDDDVPHTATAKDGSWDTGLLNKGESKTITFDKPGTYEYYCKVHPNQIGRIVVQ